jgi:transposase
MNALARPALEEAIPRTLESDLSQANEYFSQHRCDKATEAGIRQMLKIAKTLWTHTSGILAYVEHSITSGKIEIINNKIKTLTKRSKYKLPG